MVERLELAKEDFKADFMYFINILKYGEKCSFSESLPFLLPCPICT